MMKRLSLLIIYTCCSCLMLMAQSNDEKNRDIYQKAEAEYEVGRIEQAQQMLSDHLRGFTGTIRQSALRLLSLCALGLDDNEQASFYARELLDENPYFSATADDPQRFADMVESIKAGRTATITTASSRAESLNEVPVPTTLITQEMIRNSGARNLQEVLAAYVPGMHIVDSNDDINIAMRGIYSNSQEKILIMLNGHRLNSYCTNIAAPDFGISLEKLKQIEVLRGPASSLYGGVALTAVVNLITLQGLDLDGIKVKAGAGNYGQIKCDVLFGKRYFDLDMFVWGSAYKANGEVTTPELEDDIYGQATDEVTVGRIGKKPSYDFGIQMKWKGLQFMYDTHFSQVMSPLTMSTLSKPYQYDKFRTFNGITPSFTTQSHHADLSYEHELSKVNLRGSLTYDNSDLTHYQVISEYPLADFSIFFANVPEIAEAFLQNGTARHLNGREQSYGIQLKGDYQYVNNDRHKGSLMFGAEYSHFQLDDMRYNIVYDYTSTTHESYALAEIGKGHEDFYNAFAQLKHQWGPLIVNAGMRYDHKVRYNNSRVNEWSPRLAFIFLQPKWNLKLSYSKSFVDAPYLYRKTNLVLSTMMSSIPIDDAESSEALDPESMHSLQFTFAGTEWIKGLNFEANFFYNRATNLIVTHIIDYLNEGNNKAIGVELMSSYHHRKFTADFNLTWMNTIRNIVAEREINANNNTPKVMSNLVLGWQATKQLKLHTHLAFSSKQTTYNSDIVQMFAYTRYALLAQEAYEHGHTEEYLEWMELAKEAYDRLVYQRDMKATLLCNLGAEYQIGKLTLGFDIHNVFNTSRFLSGMNTKLVPQKGRWFMFSVGYHF